MAKKSSKSNGQEMNEISPMPEAENNSQNAEERIKVPSPVRKEVDSLQYYFGRRKLEAFDNSEILRCRLLYQVESSKIKNCCEIVNKQTGKTLGIVPRLQLRHSWRMAHSKDACKVVKNKLFFMTYEEWEEDLNRIEKYIKSRRAPADRSRTVFFSDVWELSEIEYEEAGLKRPQQFMALLQTAILGDMEENRRTILAWRKIKKYIHRVPLEASRGGVFSDEDARKLSAVLNIKYLNDIKKLDIFALKNAVLDFDFEKIVKDINAAYKEDLARRYDFRYKVHPFLAAFTCLAAVLYLAYTNQYTLIKNEELTNIIMGVMTVCVLQIVMILIGGLRAKRRRLKRRDYYYYTAPVKRSIKWFACIGIFTIMSIFVFYQRYDGYNSHLYYRDLDDGTIAIAGLVDEDNRTVTIPSTIDDKQVTEIDLFAFNNDNITDIVLCEGIKKIDTGAFRNCEYLDSIVIRDSVTEIGAHAFRGCLQLDSVYIPEGVEEIKSNTFRNCGITKLTFSENGAVTIGKNAFRDCHALTTVENMSAVKSIGNYAFMDCSSLEGPEFSDKLEGIGIKAFYRCSSLTSVQLPSTLSSIGRKAFFYCDSITDFAVPYTGTSAQESSNQSITKILKFTYPDEKSVNVTLNSSTALGKKAFRNASWINSVSLDDSITEIHEKAFSGATKIKRIKMSAGVTTIYESMFADNNTLQSMTGMSQVINIEKDAFSGCTFLTDLDLEAVETIGETAFANCESLSDFGTLASLKSIGAYAFENCFELDNTFYVASSLEEIGSYAFSGSRFTGIECEEGLTTIADNAFYGCSQIQYVAFPNSLRTIGAGAFESCSSLESIDLSGTSVADVGSRAFANCTSLTSVALSSDMEVISDYMFYGCSNFDGFYDITNIEYLTLTSIGNSAFENCEMGGYSLTVPSSVRNIGSRAFAGTRINSLVLPDGLSSIGSEAFTGCYYLGSARVPFLGQTSAGNEAGYSWVFGTSEVDSITITNVYSISKNTFAGGENYVQTVTLEDGVQRIEASAFKNFAKLEAVVLPDSVTYIGESAFENCSLLQNISIPSGVRKIENSTFSNCRSLSNISIPSLAVTSIGDYAFVGTGVVSSGFLTFHQDLVSVGAGAFASCGVREVVLTDGMTGIDVNAFGVDPDLTILVSSQDLYDHYTEIFENCKNVSVTYN